MRIGIGKSLAFCLLALAGCDSYVHGNGVYGQEARSVPAFGGVSIGLGILGTVRSGASETAVTISGDANVLQYIKTEVVDGILTTRLSGVDDFDSDHPIQLVVATPQLAYAEGYEGAWVSVSSITETGTFTGRAREGSALVLSGADLVEATLLSLSAAGTSAIDAVAYPAIDASATLSGGSRAQVTLTGTATGTLSDGSTLTIHGGGACAVTVSGGAACVEATP